MKQILVMVMVLVAPLSAMGNACPAAVPTGCTCPDNTTIRTSCDFRTEFVMGGTCTGCNLANGTVSMVFTR